MSAHSGPTVAELVRLDLVHRETQGDAPGAYYAGPTAILDAYDMAMDLVCYIRAIIEEMQIGDGSLDKPTHQSHPHFAAARLRTDDEEMALRPGLNFIRKAVPGQ